MDRRSGMYKRGAHLVSSLRSPPGAPATICLSVPMAWEISRRPSICRDGTARDTAIAVVQRQQLSPGGIDPLEHGWIVHSQWARPCKSRTRGSLRVFSTTALWHKIPENHTHDDRERPLSEPSHSASLVVFRPPPADDEHTMSWSVLYNPRLCRYVRGSPCTVHIVVSRGEAAVTYA